MKKLMILCSVSLLIFGFAGMASATPYAFEDLIDYWNLTGTSYGESSSPSHPFDSVVITENCPLHYIHSISDDVNFGAGDLVTSASLELDFTNDFADVVFTGFWSGLSDTTEHIYYAFDGNAWVYLDEVDNGQYTIGVDVALLNVDGELVVDLSVSNWDNGGTTAWLDHSRLYGTAETAPSPEPATMILLGSGLVGLSGIRRKFRKN